MQKFVEDLSALGYDLKVCEKRSILTELQELGVKEQDLASGDADFLEFLKTLQEPRRDAVKDILKQDAEKVRGLVTVLEARLQPEGNLRVRTKFFVAPYNAGLYFQARIIHLKSK